MVLAWPSHGLVLCPGNHSPVTTSALQRWVENDVLQLTRSQNLIPPNEAERGSPAPPKCLCSGSLPLSKGNKGEEASSAQAQPSSRGAPARPQHSTAVPLPSDHAPQHLQPLLQQCRDGGSLLPSAPGGGSGRLCWSRRGAAHSPPSGAAVPACPCRAQAGTSQQDPMEAWIPVLLPGGG